MSGARQAISIIALTAWRGVALVLSVLAASLLAHIFGVSAATDAFFFARRLTLGLSSALERCLQLIYVPSLVDVAREHGLAALHRALVSWQTKAFLVTTGITIAMIIAAPWIVAGMAPGFDGEQRQLAVQLLQIMSAAFPLAAYTSMSGAFLNSQRQFSLPAIARVLPRLAVVVVLMFMIPPLGIVSVGASTTIGTVVMALLFAICGHQIMRRARKEDEASDFPAGARPRISSKGRVLPLVAAQAHMQGSAWIDVLFASLVGAGSLAMLEFGQRVTNLAPGVISNSVSQVYYTEYAHALIADDRPGFVRQIAASCRLTLFYVMPGAAVLIVLANVIVAALLQHGSFDHEAARTTTQIIKLLAPVLIVNALLSSLVSAIFADGHVPQTRVLSAVAVIGLTTRVVLNLALLATFGVLSIPISTIASMSLLMILLYIILRNYWGPILLKKDVQAIALMVFCGGFAAAAGFGLLSMFGDILRYSVRGQIGITIMVSGLICSAYLISALTLGMRETEVIKYAIRRLSLNRFGSAPARPEP